VNTFVTNITTTLNATFSNAVTSLNAVAQSVTDSKYGLVAGMNCKVIGEDFTTFTTTFCQSLFTVLYFSRLVVGCASFGILFAICCGACTGVRFYKQSIRKLNSIDNTGLSDNEVEDITNMNFVKPKIL
jgi:formyltetrahydrofolate synthetase